MRRTRVSGEGTYSARHNRRRSSDSDGLETRGVVNRFRALADIPDVDGKEIDYGLGGDETSQAYSMDQADERTSHDEFKSQELNQIEQPVYGEDGVDWDADSVGEYSQPDVAGSGIESEVDESRRQESEILAFSRKPRPVQFKPYTLQQYKLIKPKEYIEYPKLQPGMIHFLISYLDS